jgi:hypothetical protein
MLNPLKISFVPASAVLPGWDVNIDGNNAEVVDVIAIPNEPVQLNLSDGREITLTERAPVSLVRPLILPTHLPDTEIALLSLLDDVNISGGLIIDADGCTYPAADTEWTDIANSVEMGYGALVKARSRYACLLITDADSHP